MSRFYNDAIFWVEVDKIHPNPYQPRREFDELQLKSLAGDLADAKNVTLTFGAGVEDKIAELGYSEIYGARPLRNAISEKLRGPMAEDILRENIKKGDYIEVGLDNVRFIFSKKND